MLFSARRRSAVVLASVLALAAAPLLLPTTAGATVFDSISSIVDPVGDTQEVGLLFNEFVDQPRADITAASVRYQNGNVTFTMKLVKGIDLSNAQDQLFWGVTNANSSPEYTVSIMRGANLMGEAVVRKDVPDADNPPIKCPGTGAAFDVVTGSYTVSVPATCLGSRVSFHWGAFSRVQSLTPGGPMAFDFGPDNAYAEAAIPAMVTGYWAVGSDGKVYDFGDAPVMGQPGTATMVDIEASRFGKGYWTMDEKGVISAFGNNGWSDGHPGPLHYGSVPAGQLKTGEKAVSLSGTPTGSGYWVFTNTGRMFAFGDANKDLGDLSTIKLNGEVLDSAATPSGNGYYLVAADGGVFTLGDAKFEGSTGSTKLNQPVQSIVPDPDGTGYWLVASDGGVFSFKADFKGSTGSVKLNKPMTGMVPFGNGYLMVAEDGGVFNFSDKAFSGSLGNNPPANPIVSITALS